MHLVHQIQLNNYHNELVFSNFQILPFLRHIVPKIRCKIHDKVKLFCQGNKPVEEFDIKIHKLMYDI